MPWPPRRQRNSARDREAAAADVAPLGTRTIRGRCDSLRRQLGHQDGRRQTPERVVGNDDQLRCPGEQRFGEWFGGFDTVKDDDGDDAFGENAIDHGRRG